MTPLQWDINGQQAQFGGANWAPRSVTVDGYLYYAHEANYFFWGFMNAEAYRRGASTSEDRTVVWI